MRSLCALLVGLCLLTGAGCGQPCRPSAPAPVQPVYVDCPDCSGSGWKCSDGVCKKCKRCEGSGKVLLKPAPAPTPDDDVEAGKRRRRRR